MFGHQMASLAFDYKEAAASEAAGQTKEEFSGNDTSRHPKVLKLGPKLGYQ